MIDYALILGMIYLSDVINIYFPLKKKRQRVINKDKKDESMKLELRDILSSTLCIYLDSDTFVSKLNDKYFKDINDINRIKRYNNNVDKLKEKIIKRHKNKLEMKYWIKKKDILNVKIDDIEVIKKDVLNAFRINSSVKLRGTKTLGDIYKLFISYDFYTHHEREGLLNMRFKEFVNKFLPNKYNNETDPDNLSITQKELEEIVDFVIRIEYEYDTLDKIDIEISKIILLTSMWTFCIYFKDILKTFSRITPKSKKCLIDISELEFDVFYNKYIKSEVECKIN